MNESSSVKWYRTANRDGLPKNQTKPNNNRWFSWIFLLKVSGGVGGFFKKQTYIQGIPGRQALYWKEEERGFCVRKALAK